jgi:hypothetical protein
VGVDNLDAENLAITEVLVNLLTLIPRQDDDLSNSLVRYQSKKVSQKWLTIHIDHGLG